MRSLDDFSEARIGVFSGTSQDLFVGKTYPKAHVIRFNSKADQVLSLQSGKVDVIVDEVVSLRMILEEVPELEIISEGFCSTDHGVAFRKTDQNLRRRFNQFLADIEADGTFTDMHQRWMSGNPEEATMPGIPVPENGKPLRIGTSLVLGLPYVSVKDGQYIGFEIELARRFAAREGFTPEFVPLEFDSLIAALAAGKIDMIICNLSVTEERSRVVDFSDPYGRETSAAAAMKTSQAVNADGQYGHGWRSFKDLANGRLAIFSGTAFDRFLAQNYPAAKIIRLNSSADMVLSVKHDRVDAALMPEVSARLILKTNPSLAILDKDILPLPLGIAFGKKNEDLRERFNLFLRKIRANGIYDEMFRRWYIEDPEQAIMPEITRLNGGRKVQVGVAIDDLPCVGVANGELIGFDVELLYRFAAAENLDMNFTTYEFDSLINALASGKADLVADGIAITEERAKAVDFSDTYLEIATVALVKKSNIYQSDGATMVEGGTDSLPRSWFKKFKASIHSNFIVENRWKLVLNGLWITLVISVAATLLGTLLGSVICWLRMSGNRILRRCGSGYIAVVRGLPVLLMLMLIYYVVFASVNIHPVLVAVIAFGANFAAYVAEMFRTGIEGVDRGQTEAGIAMGFTRVQTFCRIVLPQAVRRILPVYRGEFISLVKMTSVVGYIGVQDLTKAGDIIRSRTFEAFFPLIKVALLYFLIIWVLGLGLDYIERKTDPKAAQRKRARS
ncbi:MAG: ABC transporter permease subunit [Kiritimatiellae bacterium]|nr:ABC transporter permease subunit [Kiritimatiellia bacterium]MDD4735249.1 ABC transporter permease subunit [Kiritimatiellia bacterium]